MVSYQRGYMGQSENNSLIYIFNAQGYGWLILIQCTTNCGAVRTLCQTEALVLIDTSFSDLFELGPEHYPAAQNLVIISIRS